jgi:Tfp pilus assembly protein PilF
MKFPAAALALLMCSASAAAQAGDPYDQAVQARMAGDDARAVELLRPVVAADPRNSDAQLQLGLALLGLGRLDEAEAAFRRTLEIAPDYADARLGLARVEQRRGNWAAAEAALAGVVADHAEAGPLRLQIQAGLRLQGSAVARRRGWRLRLPRQDSPDWKEGSLRVTHQPSRATAVSAGWSTPAASVSTDTYASFVSSSAFRT